MNLVQRTLLVATAAVAAACTADSAMRSPTHPRLVVTTGTVTCPDTISVGQTAQCVAYFYDENHNLISPTTPTWSTTTSTLVSVSGSGQVTGLAVGSAVVQATYSGVVGSKNVYVKPGLSVSITGPSPLRKLDPCQWGAAVTGGTAPYTFAWSKAGGYGTGNGDTFSGYLVSSQMNLTVVVTDANGVSKTVTRAIIGDPNAPNCY
ncbi:MAG TPA: hypothetical protein VFJ82_00810 [Longimicrobium sp.]|nr:hypothetical protein [Longimicrobium sp.]